MRRPKSQKTEAKPSSTITASRLQLRVLVVDDNAVNQRVALRMLAAFGYRADVASNGVEALDMLHNCRYDLLFMDVQMPVMDGLEATKRIVEIYGKKRPRIIAMTANALSGDAETCFAAGMDDYVAKPVRMQDLQRALKRQVTIEAAPTEEVMLDRETLAELRRVGVEAETDLVGELVGLFLKDTPLRLAALKASLAAADSDGSDAIVAEREAHTLKSSSAALGARLMSTLCKDIERFVHDADFAAARAKVPELEAMMTNLLPLLEKELGATSANGEPACLLS